MLHWETCEGEKVEGTLFETKEKRNCQGEDPRTFKEPVESWRVQKKWKEKKWNKKKKKKKDKKNLKYSRSIFLKKGDRKHCKLSCCEVERRRRERKEGQNE